MKIRYISFTLGLSIVLFSSCTDDGPDFGKDPLVPTGEGKMEVLSPEEQIGFIEETAGLALTHFNPEDQKELILNVAYAEAAYGSLQAPAEWREFADKALGFLEKSFEGSLDSDKNKANGNFFKPMAWIQGMSEGMTSSNPMELTRASFNIVNSIYFKDFSGIYIPGDGEWVLSEKSDDIEFRFPGADGQIQSFKITASDKTFLYSFVEEEWKGSDVYYTSTAIYLPTTITAEYIVHGQSLADCKLNYTVEAKKNGTYDVDIEVLANAANLQSTLHMTATDKRLSAEYDFSVSGSKLTNGAIVAHGNNLTNLQHIMLLTKVEDVAMLVKNVEAYTNILDRIQINGEFSMNENFFHNRTIITSLEENSKESAEKEVKKAAETFNKYTRVWMRFNNTRTKQSDLRWTSRSTDLPEGWIISMQPQIYFPADNSTYDLDQLIESGFTNITQGITQLIEAYKASLGR